MISKFKRIAAAGLMAAASVSAFAVDTVALTTQNPTGDQDFFGLLGMDFTVVTPINVTTLGTYDAAPIGITAPGAIEVGIFRIADGALMGSTVTFTNANQGTLLGFDRFLDVPDFVLAPGVYSIVALGFSAINLNGNLDSTGGARTPSVINTGGGQIAFINGARYQATTTFGLPNITDGGPENRYDAGTFTFTSAVPEPSSLMMMLAALGVVGTVVRRRSAV